jgi:hypothetical protein
MFCEECVGENLATPSVLGGVSDARHTFAGLSRILVPKGTGIFCPRPQLLSKRAQIGATVLNKAAAFCKNTAKKLGPSGPKRF